MTERTSGVPPVIFSTRVWARLASVCVFHYVLIFIFLVYFRHIPYIVLCISFIYFCLLYFTCISNMFLLYISNISQIFLLYLFSLSFIYLLYFSNILYIFVYIYWWQLTNYRTRSRRNCKDEVEMMDLHVPSLDLQGLSSNYRLFILYIFIISTSRWLAVTSKWMSAGGLFYFLY